ncbi:MAG: YggS family pyridoxal phosphate-dependent enzyme [Chitinophagaceae bacterium]|nr:YggS family pyridoxal phosphate-dependent enzyme [Chitinophagaceae bacterium]
MDQTEFYKLKKELTDAQVTLVAVSKTKPAEDIQQLYDLGHRDFGENYVQELVAKQPALPSEIQWHFIGHLQTNKVKYIAPFVYMIQSVDSEKLLREINKEAIKHKRIINVLLEVHVAKEDSKFGLNPENVTGLVKTAANFPNVRLRGIMGMATLTENKNQIEREFKKLNQIFEECRKQPGLTNWDTLSMGMSADYPVAIRNGSTMVRIGSLIFGERGNSDRRYTRMI